MEGNVWGSFAHDPRDPAAAPLRASDADREVIHAVLADAFAEGRLDHAEYDERSSSVWAARTLGELPPIVADLVPALPARASGGRVPLVAASPADLRRRAEESFEEGRRNAFLGFLAPTLICWAIWFALAVDNDTISFADDFPWPLIVMAATLVNVVRTVSMKKQIIEDEVRRLERKQAKELERKRRHE